ISKVHEETVRGTLAEVIQHFTETEPKGEIVVVLAGKEEVKAKGKKNKYSEQINEQ
ncbi:MAG: 16S rRNA (cytidine(1402)-2'-O)-methyltransferase, partial [Bacteroidaceae bacterium]|nr:16S rRNA (cytidine(1402)-2'-O)-methyltransferase [Bacteroidaceae bacterium]